MMAEDMDLVREYARHKSERAFAELVSRHINLVYSAAYRHVQNVHLAEEITQAVFVLLAQKAASLDQQTILPAWLCRASRNIASRALTMEHRRHKREHEAYMQSITEKTDSDSNAWKSIIPFLDAAFGQLKENEYDAIVLRFFNHKSFKEVAVALGTSEDSARMRVNRSLEKMRTFFLKRGVTLSVAAIAVAMAENSVQAAPSTLAKSVTAAALAKGALAGSTSLTSIKGALKIMAWSKAKITSVTVFVLLITAGTATVATTGLRHHREEVMWNQIVAVMKGRNNHSMSELPRAFSMRSSKLNGQFHDNYEQWDANNKILGLAIPAAGVWGHAYNISRNRILNQDLLPPGSYDFICSDSPRPQKTLQAAINKKFGLIAEMQMIETNVLVLSVARPNAAGLQSSAGGGYVFSVFPGGWAFTNVPMSALAIQAEHLLKIPVIDQTGLADRYDMELSWGGEEWSPDADKFKQVLLDQLGLQLKPDTQAIEMLVLKKAK